MIDVSVVGNQILYHEHFNEETFRKYYFNNYNITI